MLLPLLLGSVLAVAQDTTVAEPAATPAAEPPKEATRYFLESLLLPEDSKLRVYGWTGMSFTGSSASSKNLPVGMNYLANEFMLQQNWLRIEKTIDTESKDFDWGFRSDTILPGTDYRFTIARGLFDGQLTSRNGNPRRYGIDPVQFYLEGYLPGVADGLTVKVGRMYTMYGVESIDTTLNPLVSLPYTFLYDPFTMTGALATLQVNKDWSVSAGIMTGQDVFIDNSATPTFVGQLRWAPKDGNTTMTFSTIMSDPHYYEKENVNRQQVFDFVLTQKITDKLLYTFNGLYGYQLDVPGYGDVQWYGLVNYLAYTINDKVTSTTRLEFYDDCQGQRTGYKGLYTAITTGVNYLPTDYLIIRPELRYDYNDTSKPFEGRSQLYTAGIDVIVRW